jgi:lipopolysaccharide transport system ATP-binding protein
MSSDLAVRVEKISKRYRLTSEQPRLTTLREAVMASLTRPFEARGETRELWALRDVSCDVRRGEVLGVIGDNGAGKSTLLKILSRIVEPTDGRVELWGRFGSLLELGVGFHPELSGRDNVFLNGILLGMKKAEVARRFDEIVAFAEVEGFVDTPVKHYSSGMYMRLAFAVAAHLDLEILLVDEVLAVGDVGFQRKCLGRMQGVTREGRAVVFVSHNMGAIGLLCDRTLHLEGGAVRALGPTAEVVSAYLARAFAGVKGESIEKLRPPGHGISARFESIRIAGGAEEIPFGEPIVYEVELSAKEDLDGLSLSSSIFAMATATCVGNLFTKEKFSMKAGEKVRTRLTIKNASLAPGVYYGAVSVGWEMPGVGRHDADVIVGQPVFRVAPVAKSGRSLAHWQASWGSVVFDDVSLEVLR